MNMFDGIRVVDFTTNAAGPLATAFLADFGAEVIKIEKPGGDDMRTYPPFVDGVGYGFLWINRGKKSIVLDLNDPQGRDIAMKLVATADVVVESFKPGTMAHFGMGYDDLKKINPQLIMCSVSAFGQTGPYSVKPGYDIVAQALSGVMDMTGAKDGPPTRVGITIADYNAGVQAYAAMATALYYRKCTGVGQYLDIALLDCLAALNSYIDVAGMGRKTGRSGNHNAALAPFGVFNGSDGSIIVGAPNPKMWSALCKTMGKPQLIEDPAFSTVAVRVQNLDRVIKEIEEWLKSFPSVDEPLALIDKAGVPCAKVNTSAQALNNEHLKARGMIQEMRLPEGMPTGKFTTRGTPWKFSEVDVKLQSPPLLGQHQDEVLKAAGYDEATIAGLNSKWGIKK
jgi:CoA:oxalate CoA-transferase